jgi:hypothetical protein
MLNCALTGYRYSNRFHHTADRIGEVQALGAADPLDGITVGATPEATKPDPLHLERRLSYP